MMPQRWTLNQGQELAVDRSGACAASPDLRPLEPTNHGEARPTLVSEAAATRVERQHFAFSLLQEGVYILASDIDTPCSC